MEIIEEIYSTQINNNSFEKVKIFSNIKKIDLKLNQKIIDIYENSNINKYLKNNKNIIVEYRSRGYIDYKNSSEVLRGLHMNLDIKDFVNNKVIKKFYNIISINSYNKTIEKNFIKLYKKSLKKGRKVILNSFSYNLGSKGIKQQFNFELNPEGIDLYLIDPNFGLIKKDEFKQIYHMKEFIKDKTFKINIRNNDIVYESGIIRKYTSESLNMNIYTIPMCIDSDVECNFYKISKDHIVDRHENLMAVSFNHFLTDGKLMF